MVIYFLTLIVFLTLTEGFPCFFLSCKANARVKFAKTGDGPHSSKLVAICVILLLFVLCIVGDRGSTVVKALRYKSEGRGVDSRWLHWNFSLT